MPKIKDVSLERYYFNEISVRLNDGRVQSTDKILGKNFGVVFKYSTYSGLFPHFFLALSSIAARRGGQTNFQQNQTNSAKAIICPKRVAFKFIFYATNNK